MFKDVAAMNPKLKKALAFSAISVSLVVLASRWLDVGLAFSTAHAAASESIHANNDDVTISSAVGEAVSAGKCICQVVPSFAPAYGGAHAVDGTGTSDGQPRKLSPGAERGNSSNCPTLGLETARPWLDWISATHARRTHRVSRGADQGNPLEVRIGAPAAAGGSPESFPEDAVSSEALLGYGASTTQRKPIIEERSLQGAISRYLPCWVRLVLRGKYQPEPLGR